MWVMWLWGHAIMIIKWDWGNFFPNIGKWFTPTMKDKNVTHSNSLLKESIERKHPIYLISVKGYKKGFAFLVTLTLTIFPKDSKGVFTIVYLA